MANYYNKAGKNKLQSETARPTRPSMKVDKYGRMEHNYPKNWIQKLLAIPRKITDVVVGPHKCGEDGSIYPLCGPDGHICQTMEPQIDIRFQGCLLKYRKKRKPIEQIAMFGSIGLALYGIYWLGTKNKIK